MSSTELQQATTILETLGLGEFVATLKTCGNNNELANRLRGNNHYSVTVTKPRMYLTSEVDATPFVPVDNRSVSPSSRKTCLTEKFFVCLACIFE
jgi:hypothetical protein